MGEKEEKDKTQEQENYEQVLKLCGITQKEVKNAISDLLQTENPKIELSSEHGEVILKVSAVKEEDKGAKKLAKPVIKEIKARFSEKIYTTEEGVSLAETIVELLTSNSLTLCTAESCTGGMIAARLVDIPGVSAVFKEGFVTYSNKAKRARLGVKKSTLLKHGAVSEQTVKEMVKGGIFAAKTDICLAVSGLAGPDGGTEEKPVGTVFIGCGIKGKINISEFHFKGERNEIRERTVTEALALLRVCILKYYSEKNFAS